MNVVPEQHRGNNDVSLKGFAPDAGGIRAELPIDLDTKKGALYLRCFVALGCTAVGAELFVFLLSPSNAGEVYIRVAGPESSNLATEMHRSRGWMQNSDTKQDSCPLKKGEMYTGIVFFVVLGWIAVDVM